ncbi:MAG: PRC-barrel domain-containing protein [Azospirillaceae bacterium]|nr:PRC-barrel domain-containing protein [Azospirillaceae bacterium]
MLINASELKGYALMATDGRIGTVSDFLFDDTSWFVRWMVVDTGHWLKGRKVLLPPSVLDHVDRKEHEFAVSLTMKQVESSPDIDTEHTVSRQMETYIYDHYGWGPYWGTGLYMGGDGYMDTGMVASLSQATKHREEDEKYARERLDDPHLRSIAAISGYHIHACDGEIGHVEDFALDEADWSIDYLIVDTRNWWPGKRVLLSPRTAQNINWTDRLVNLSISRQSVTDSPVFDPSTPTDPDHDKLFHYHYGNKELDHLP